jgi:hypothetical protein
MPRILICTVGGQPAPVVAAVRENGPLDLVVFLCSTGKTPGSSAVTVTRGTERVAAGRCPFCDRSFETRERVRSIVEMAELAPRQYRLEGVDDPDDLCAVLTACERIEADLLARWPRGEVTVLANYTGGTKTMSLGLGFYALQRARRLWSLQVNRSAGPRPDLVRVRGGDLPVEQNLSKILAEAVWERTRFRLEHHDHRAAVRVLADGITRLRLSRGERSRLMEEHLRCRILEARERLDFAGALDLIGQHEELRVRFTPRLELLQRIVSALESPDPWPDPSLLGLELVDELRDNAERCAVREGFEQALLRFRQATVLLARLRLRRLYGVRFLGVSGRGFGLEGLGGYPMLVELGDALGRYFSSHGLELEKLLEACRSSLVGSGLRPVFRADWQRLAPRWRGWLDGAQEIL